MDRVLFGQNILWDVLKYLLSFQAKTFPIHSIISYQCLYSNLANITEKFISTLYLTNMNGMAIHQLLLSHVSDGISILRIYIFTNKYYTLHKIFGY